MMLIDILDEAKDDIVNSGYGFGLRFTALDPYVPVRPETKRSERPRDLQPIYEKTEF